MYELFFGMDRRPFSAPPNVECFFSSSELQAVLDELILCVERGQGIGILTGPAGLGKTLLCQQLAASIRQRGESEPQFECVLLNNSNFPTRRALLQAILFEMGDEYSRREESELRIALRSHLLSLRPQREALVLIVDEAHLFGDELLEELRTMTDIADNGTSLVRIVLAGQHELEERLTDRSFDALNQRISNHVFIESLTISESVEYIRHRLAWAGCDIEAAFTEEAVGIISRASGGVPRCLNQLSDHSLLLAFASEQKPVTEEIVREALEDLKQLPLHWNDVSDGTAVVGFVDDDESSPGDVGDPDEESAFVDADNEAALAGVASDLVAEANHLDAVESLPSEAEATSKNQHDDAGTVGSMPTDDQATVADLPVSPILDDGIEFDFSRGPESEMAEAEDETLAEDKFDQVTDDAEFASPETSVFNFSFDESAASDDSENVELDETLVQVIPTQSQETLFESAGLSRRPGAAGAAADESSEVDGSGLSFQLTSNGFELDGFDDVDAPTAEPTENSAESGNSGAIEFALDHVTPDKPGNAETCSEYASDQVEEALSEAEPHENHAPVVEFVFDSSEQEEPDVADETQCGGSRYEEEVVFDPYATLQEPDGAGIVWDVIRISNSNQPHAEAEQPVEQIETNESVKDADSAEVIEGEDATIEGDQSTDSDEPADESSEQSYDESNETIDFDGGLTLDEDETEAQSTEPHPIDAGVLNDEGASEKETLKPDESIELDVTEVSADESTNGCGLVVDEDFDAEVVADDADSSVEESTSNGNEISEVIEEEVALELHSVQSDVFESEEEQVEPVAEDASVAEDAESQFEPESHDVVQPVEARVPQPDRLVDSILPLLNELDEDLDSVASSALDEGGRSVLDIEAELIQTIEHGSNEVEDQIGATMLDICLDTQSALQESAAALRNAATEDFEQLEIDDELNPPDLPIEPFDIVQPEPQPREKSHGNDLELHFQEHSAKPSQHERPTSPEPQRAEKPFGRLFSELRRRTT